MQKGKGLKICNSIENGKFFDGGKFIMFEGKIWINKLQRDVELNFNFFFNKNRDFIKIENLGILLNFVRKFNDQG